MRAAPPDLVLAISECAYNVLKGNVTLNKSQIRKLKRYKQQLRTLGQKHISTKKKKKVLQSGRGFFLPALLAPLIGTVLTSLLK